MPVTISELREVTERSHFGYRGMSYEQASREATRLIERHGWFQSFGRLAALREIMVREYARGHAAHFPYQSWGERHPNGR